MLIIFLLWLASFIACACIAIREDGGDRFRAKRNVIEQVLNTEVVIDNDTTTVQKLLKEYESQNVIEDGHKTLHISIPNKSIDITIDQRQGRAGSKGRRQTGEGREKPQGFGRRGRTEHAGSRRGGRRHCCAGTADRIRPQALGKIKSFFGTQGAPTGSALVFLKNLK